MDLLDFMQQLIKLKDRELEQKVWEIWLVEYPQMTADTFISYEDKLAEVKRKAPIPSGQSEDDVPGVYVDQVFF